MRVRYALALLAAALPLAAGITPSPRPLPASRLVVLSEERDGQTDLLVLNDFWGTIRRLTDTPDFRESYWCFAGGRILYFRSPTAGGAAELLSVKPDGSSPVVLFQQLLSPDPGYLRRTTFLDPGTGRIVAESNLPGNRHEIRSVLPDGSAPKSLAVGTLAGTELLNVDLLQCAPTAAGTRVLFSRYYSPPDRDLYLIAPDGSGLTTLAYSSDDEPSGRIAPNGRVYYERISGGQPDLWCVGLDGTGGRAVAARPDVKEYFIDQRGGSLLYLTRNASYHDELYLADADGGGAALRYSASSGTTFYASALFGDRILSSWTPPSGAPIHETVTIGAATGAISPFPPESTGILKAYAEPLFEFGDGRLLLRVAALKAGATYWTAYPDGSDAVSLGERDKTAFLTARTAPAPRVFQIRLATSDGGGQVWSLGPRGESPTLLTTGAFPCYDPVLRGSTLCYTTHESDGATTVYETDAEAPAAPLLLKTLPGKLRVEDLVTP